MPGVDFHQLRTEISMRQVLEALDFEPTRCTGAQWRGPCPIHGSSSARSRSFSVNLDSQRYTCHRCGSQGNQLELWAAVHRLPIYPAVLDLCRALNHDVPWVHRW
jgi:DNA primase